MTAQGLRPEAEGALGGASASGVKRDERIEQEWDIVAANVEVAAIDVGDMRERIEIVDGRAVGIVHDLSIFAVGNAEDFVERFSLRVFDDRIIEFLAADDVDYFCFIQ